MMPMPLFFTAPMISRRFSISAAEKEAVGSSRMITRRRKTSPLAISTVFCSPLERSFMIEPGRRGLFRYASTSSVWRFIAALFRNPPFSISAPVKMFSTMFRLSKTMCSW